MFEDFPGNQEAKKAEESDFLHRTEIVSCMERLSQNIEENCLQELSGSFSASLPPLVSIDKPHFSQAKDEGN